MNTNIKTQSMINKQSMIIHKPKALILNNTLNSILNHQMTTKSNIVSRSSFGQRKSLIILRRLIIRVAYCKNSIRNTGLSRSRRCMQRLTRQDGK